MDSVLFMQNEPNFGWSRPGHRRARHSGSRHAAKLRRLWIGWPRPVRNRTDKPENCARTNPNFGCNSIFYKG